MNDKIIVLAGKVFQIPELAIRQMMVIFPLMPKIIDSFKESLKMKTEDWNDIMTVIHTAVQKGNPSVTRDQLLDMPIKPAEIIAAIAVIASQCGMVSSSGEASGERPDSPTGAI